MKIYHVVYKLEGVEAEKVFQATSAGQAFSLLLEKFPTAILIKAYRQGGALGGWGYTEYKPPSRVKVQAGPKEKYEQGRLL